MRNDGKPSDGKLAKPSWPKPSWPWQAFALLACVVAVVGLAFFGAGRLVDAKGHGLIAAQERDAMADELDMFAVVDRDEGTAGLIREVGQQVELNGEDKVFAVRDASGRLIAGNLAVWPQGVPDQANWLPARNIDVRGSMHLSTRRLDDGSVVLAGHADDVLETFHATILKSVWLALGLVALTCLLMAGALASYVVLRVRELLDTAARVAEGDFSARATRARGTGPFSQIARAQNTMLDRIEDLVTGLRTVTDSLAHDLRTPLARTRGQIERGVLADTSIEKQVALEEALMETDRTISTFTSLIDIARAEGGLSRDSMAALDLAGLAADVNDLFEPMAEEKDVALSFQAPTMPVFGHRTLLMQAVSNLVHNAIKFSPPGGRVELTVAGGDGTIEIRVCDNGPGIPAGDRADAVRRFTQVGAPGRPEGLGLGLAIVEACARLHRGRLVLEDNDPGLKASLVLALR